MSMQTVTYFLYPVVDISAHGGCTITPINPTTLTATGGGVLASGTENVMIKCNCTDDDGMVVDRVRWYDPDEIRLVDPDFNYNYVAGTPHLSRVNGTGDNIILVIPTFNDSYDGIYTCGERVISGLPGPPNAGVVLTIFSKLMIHVQ